VKAKPQKLSRPADGELHARSRVDPNTYLAFGTRDDEHAHPERRPRYNPGALPNRIEPSLNPDGSCRIGDPANPNWGEPNGGAGAVKPCQSYFPIIYVRGSASIQGNGRGQGILIVDGDLRLNGTFDWLGLVLVKDDMNKGNGTATITGAVMARNIDLADASVFGGNQSVSYSKCAIESALRGSAILIRVRDRSWTQLF
jgi:hypothetical protein